MSVGSSASARRRGRRQTPGADHQLEGKRHEQASHHEHEVLELVGHEAIVPHPGRADLRVGTRARLARSVPVGSAADVALGTAAIEVDGLAKRYGPTVAVDDVTLSRRGG